MASFDLKAKSTANCHSYHTSRNKLINLNTPVIIGARTSSPCILNNSVLLKTVFIGFEVVGSCDVELWGLHTKSLSIMSYGRGVSFQDTSSNILENQQTHEFRVSE